MGKDCTAAKLITSALAINSTSYHSHTRATELFEIDARYDGTACSF